MTLSSAFKTAALRGLKVQKVELLNFANRIFSSIQSWECSARPWFVLTNHILVKILKYSFEKNKQQQQKPCNSDKFF